MMFKILETDDLIIRPFTKNDIKSVFRLSRESSLGEWIPDQVYKDEDEAAGVVEYLMSLYQKPLAPNRRPLVLAVELRTTNELIGHVGLSPLHGEIEIGYAIAEDHCGNGYATQAVAAISKWALFNLGIQRILGVVACENIGSLRVLEKAGFDLESESRLSYLGKERPCRKYSFSKTVSSEISF